MSLLIPGTRDGRRRTRHDEWGDTFTVDHADGLAGLLPRIQPAFFRHAACKNADPDLFFPEQGDAGDAAKAICATCTVRPECLAWGLTEDHGIWGGLSLRTREKLNANGWQPGDPVPPIKVRKTGVSHGTERAAHAHRAAGEPLCPACRAWQDRRRARAMRARKDAAEGRQARPVIHGKSGYVHRACRCEVCTEAYSSYRKALRARRRSGVAA